MKKEPVFHSYALTLVCGVLGVFFQDFSTLVQGFPQNIHVYCTIQPHCIYYKLRKLFQIKTYNIIIFLSKGQDGHSHNRQFS